MVASPQACHCLVSGLFPDPRWILQVLALRGSPPAVNICKASARFPVASPGFLPLSDIKEARLPRNNFGVHVRSTVELNACSALRDLRAAEEMLLSDALLAPVGGFQTTANRFLTYSSHRFSMAMPHSHIPASISEPSKRHIT